MRVIRSTTYPPKSVGPPATFTACDVDLKRSVDESVAELRAGIPVVFNVTESFSMPDGTSFERAVLEAHRRQQDREDREQNMAMLFYYNGMTIDQKKRQGIRSGARLHVKNPGGAPLSTEEIVYTFEQLARHPVYTPDVRVETHSLESGAVVVLDGGVVAVGSSPPFGGRGRYHDPN